MLRADPYLLSSFLRACQGIRSRPIVIVPHIFLDFRLTAYESLIVSRDSSPMRIGAFVDAGRSANVPDTGRPWGSLEQIRQSRGSRTPRGVPVCVIMNSSSRRSPSGIGVWEAAPGPLRSLSASLRQTVGTTSSC
jgi:hypothetical protein